MEQDILKQIYFGEIVPWENRNDRTPEMAEIADRIDGEIERLKGLLDDEGKALLEKLLDDASDLECKTICEGFKDGFRLGAQITAASMGSLKKPKIHKSRLKSLCNICLELTCYYPLLERICVLPKGKTHKENGGKQHERKVSKTG